MTDKKPKKCGYCFAEFTMCPQPQGPDLPYCTPDCPGSRSKEVAARETKR